jgi:hypothetical protein
MKTRDRQRALPGRPILLRPDPGAIADAGVRSLSRAALAEALSEVETAAKFPSEYAKRAVAGRPRRATFAARHVSADQYR